MICEGYCDGCKKAWKARNGEKFCEIYEDPVAKVRTHGCNFSPVESKKADEKAQAEKKVARVGQQKQQKKR